MRSSVLASVIACVCACGRLGFESVPGDAGTSDDTVREPGTVVAGSRLTPIYVTADGARLFDGWHDTQLGIDCMPSTFLDGAVRCIPRHAEVASRFADAACTIPVAIGYVDEVTCGGQPRFAIDVEYMDGPDLIAAVYELAGELTGTTYELDGSAMCAPATSLPLDEVAFSLGPSVPPSTFVTFTEEVTPVGDVGVVEYAADDGARFPSGEIHDIARDLRCLPFPLGGDRGLCASLITQSAFRGFKDAACSEPILLPMGAEGHVILPGDDLCGDAFRIVELGATYAGTTYTNFGGCAEATGFGQAFELGADVTSSFLSLTMEIAPGTSRVREIRWRTPDGVLLRDTFSLWDTQRNYPCIPGAGPDDELLCVPGGSIGYGHAQLFTDSTCQDAVDGVPTCHGSEGPLEQSVAPPFRFTCNGVPADFYAFDVPATSPLYQQRDDGCAPFTDSPVLLENSTPVPPSLLPAMSYVR